MANFNLLLRSLIIGAASRGPLALLVKVPWRCESRSPVLLVKVPRAASQGPMCAASRGPWGQNKNPKILSLRRF